MLGFIGKPIILSSNYLNTGNPRFTGHQFNRGFENRNHLLKAVKFQFGSKFVPSFIQYLYNNYTLMYRIAGFGEFE